MGFIDAILDGVFLNPVVQTWISVFFTLMMLSFLYRDNPLYKIGENIFLGISLGYSWTKSFTLVIVPYVFRPMADMTVDFKAYDAVMFFWLLMGSTMLFRFSRKYSWVANYYFAFAFAYMAGYVIPVYVQQLFIQGANMMQPIFQMPTFFEISKWFVIIFGTFAGLMYFFFSKPHKGLLGRTAKIGIYILMINFGASFGATVMGRISLFIGRAQVLATNPLEAVVSGIIIIIFLFVYFKFIYKEPEYMDSSIN